MVQGWCAGVFGFLIYRLFRVEVLGKFVCRIQNVVESDFFIMMCMVARIRVDLVFKDGLVHYVWCLAESFEDDVYTRLNKC